MSAPRSSGSRAALLIGLPVLALAGAVFLVTGEDERPAPPTPRPASAESRAVSAPEPRHARPPAAPAPRAAATAEAAAPPPRAEPDEDPEAGVIERMRAALEADPEEVLRLDDAASRDLGDGARAAERGLLRVRALVRLSRAGEARSLAEELVERYPDDPSAKSAAAYMGVHPRPRGPSR
ncbi:uncharacterized protein SOCEGT47_051500 [Sorangium cellulosum]|uniref:Uncharacterized protein n=1 Tax=Sorangium cellulosum TaxID=56 RepID=A0A4P2Q5V8_SORCE|nr:hypothetical protein [Sorangium cellulosum]AUX24611.1 uncharacterized protein SOCEGT47_051500 [Sorangium cellulosum]